MELQFGGEKRRQTNRGEENEIQFRLCCRLIFGNEKVNGEGEEGCERDSEDCLQSHFWQSAFFRQEWFGVQGGLLGLLRGRFW